MAVVDPSHPLFQLLQRDRRYTLDAYLFVLESLTFAQESLGMGHDPETADLEPMPAEEQPALLESVVGGEPGRRQARRRRG